VNEIQETLWQFFTALFALLAALFKVALGSALLIAWVAWWLWAVDWRRTWAVLAEGAWMPALLIVVVSALVWSQIAPSDCACLGFTVVPNFWWQLGAVGLLAAVTLFCGWLQGVFGWTPAEISLEPPAHGGHEHGHGHEAGHAADVHHGHDHGHSTGHGHH
jgi:hypothetical protein